MTSSQRKSTECHGRRGSMSVEFALVMPPLFVLLWGIIEFGRMVMVADTREARCIADLTVSGESPTPRQMLKAPQATL